MKKDNKCKKQKNRGKQFENQIKQAFENIDGGFIQRLKDTSKRQKGNDNPCDFIAYKQPFLFLLECKSVRKNTLDWGKIRPNQWDSLLKYDRLPGVICGYLIWFIDHDITVFVPATQLALHKQRGNKSINVKDLNQLIHCNIEGKKKRVLFNYDLSNLFHFVVDWY